MSMVFFPRATRCILMALVLALAARQAEPSLLYLGVPLFLCIMLLGFVLPNTTALALAPFARDAGSASALLGTLQYGLPGVATLVIGLFHDGTPRPVSVAILLFVASALALAGHRNLKSGR